MHASKSLLVVFLSTFYTSNPAVDAAVLARPIDRCISPHQLDCFSSTSSLGLSLSRSPLPQPAPLPAADDTFLPQAMLPPPDTSLERSQSDQDSPLTPPPLSNPAAVQTSVSNPNSPQLQLDDPGLSPFDTHKCLQQRHCLVCLDPTTTLTCYKHNCQCQRGIPSSHYMPASRESCYDSELCLSCPAGTTPLTWGRMVVCLTIWKHRPVKGEGNPLTNWTEEGVKAIPVGRVSMGTAAGIVMSVPAVMWVAGLWVVVGAYGE